MKKIENLVFCFMWLFVFVTSIINNNSLECIVGCGIGLIAFTIKTIMEWNDDISNK